MLFSVKLGGEDGIDEPAVDVEVEVEACLRRVENRIEGTH